MKRLFPQPTQAPKLTYVYGTRLGYVAATLFAALAVVHLFRIDTLVPLIDAALPGGLTAANLFVVGVVVAEVFALPFLFRLSLSPLAHILSGFFVVLAPLMWTLLSFVSYEPTVSTGQLGEFIATPSSIMLVTLNLLWLSFNFVTLWALGYNNLKVKDVLKK